MSRNKILLNMKKGRRKKGGREKVREGWRWGKEKERKSRGRLGKKGDGEGAGE